MEFKERKRLLFLGLPWTFTKYTIKEDRITINKGLLNVSENDCYMYKVQDVKHSASLFERIVGIGSIVCFTGDTTDPELLLARIKHSKEIKNFILEASEQARIKRRTLNTLNIGTGEMQDINPDNL